MAVTGREEGNGNRNQRNSLSTMEHGKVEMGAEIMLRIRSGFGNSVEWLLTGLRLAKHRKGTRRSKMLPKTVRIGAHGLTSFGLEIIKSAEPWKELHRRPALLLAGETEGKAEPSSEK